MKILAVHPGASWATADVYEGITEALRRRHHTVVPYSLGYWVDVAARYLRTAYEEALDSNVEVPEPTDADALYWAAKDIVPRALRHDPDWVVIFSAMFLHPDVLPWLKRCRYKVALVFSESPYDDGPQASRLKWADVAFTNERSSVEFLRHYNPNVHYLPHAYDPERHHPSPPPGEGGPGVHAHDVVFVGTGFAERIALLEQVDWTGIDVGLYGSWNLVAHDSPILPYIHKGIVPNETTAELYRAAKIGINLYRRSYGFGVDVPQITTGESMNPRALELAANGVFTISDERAEQTEVLGDVVPTFSDGKELGRLIRHYLEHDDERVAKARQLPALVADRIFDNTARQLVTVLEA